MALMALTASCSLPLESKKGAPFAAARPCSFAFRLGAPLRR